MEETRLYFDEMETPVGPLLIISDGEKIVRIDYGRMADLEAQMNKWSKRYFDNPVFENKPEKVEHVKKELQAYFKDGSKKFSFAFTFHGTPFQTKVWQALCDTIPYGETKTYKDIAEAIDNPKAVRAVGGAVNKNPFSIVVPCHRVIGANGKMVGYNGGLDKKEYLLAHEQDVNLF
ncbi:methylated-DNA--[protein]-cysteine S-methyltransferase [Lentibacillus sp. Marseille-P4043]|uniref:methylated-DNA--[protein]-cysteine S-methyltransferase n=1 Tax=Lentibacillus sp. Marseille-P4043 TaxID=2040293 RepID=UPI000D0B1EFF|nr:methylated-DNA--[protein]-cysteine S-methyltransferase [Lentibacillus sp. Marseille-P4043]